MPIITSTPIIIIQISFSTIILLMASLTTPNIIQIVYYYKSKFMNWCHLVIIITSVLNTNKCISIGASLCL